MPSSSIVTGPSVSLATATSSSVIADATQSALRWETRPESAVTNPPPPRWTIRWPRSSRPNSAGPRLETIVRGRSGTRSTLVAALDSAAVFVAPHAAGPDRRRSGVQVGEDPQPVEQQTRGEEPLPRPLLSGAAEPASQLRVLKDLDGVLRGLVGRGDQVSVLPVDDLQRDAPHVAADRRAPLPERLGDRQSEALADRLLHDHVGLRLEGVHLDRADVVEVVEDLDVRIRAGVLEGAVEELPALRVVGGHRADQGELHLRDLLGHLAIGVDHADRILPGVEPGDLGDQGPVDVDAELVADEGGVVGGEGHVLGGEWVDGRRDDADAAMAVEALRHVLLQVPDRDVVLGDQRQ